MSLNWFRDIGKAIDKAIIKPLTGKLRKQNTRDAARARLRTLREREEQEADEEE